MFLGRRVPLQLVQVWKRCLLPELRSEVVVFSHPIDGICTLNSIQVESRALNLGPAPTTATRRCKRQCESARLPKHLLRLARLIRSLIWYIRADEIWYRQG